MSGVLILSCLTLPDLEVGKKRYQLEKLNDKEAAKAIFHLQKQSTGRTCLPLFMQQIAHIEGVYWEHAHANPQWINFGSLLNVEEVNGHEEVLALMTLYQFIKDKNASVMTWDNAITAHLLSVRSLRYQGAICNWLNAGEGKSAAMDFSSVEYAESLKSWYQVTASQSANEAGNASAMVNTQSQSDDEYLFALASMTPLPMLESLTLYRRWQCFRRSQKGNAKSTTLLSDNAFYKTHLMAYLYLARQGLTGKISIDKCLEQQASIEQKLAKFSND